MGDASTQLSGYDASYSLRARSLRVRRPVLTLPTSTPTTFPRRVFGALDIADLVDYQWSELERRLMTYVNNMHQGVARQPSPYEEPVILHSLFLSINAFQELRLFELSTTFRPSQPLCPE